MPKLLIVENDISLRSLLQITLTWEGFQVETAQDAASGVQKVYTFAPDLIVLDARLPDADGWETCRRIRDMSDAPILMLLGFASERAGVKTLEAEADAYLVKR